MNSTNITNDSVEELNYSERPWPLMPDECPCDLHFVKYLTEHRLEGMHIFHFGTGEHHLVGRDNYGRENPNEIMGITTSREEYLAYIDFITHNPSAANNYKVLFADIYTLSSRCLPKFDLVTLFHLAEFYDDWQVECGHKPTPRRNSTYARLNDTELINLFLDRLNPMGKLCFYKLSDAFLDKPHKAAVLVDQFVSQGKVIFEEEYESLLIYRSPDQKHATDN